MARHDWIIGKISLTQAMLPEKKMTGSHRGLRQMLKKAILFIRRS
jgi:hypothetical protein